MAWRASRAPCFLDLQLLELARPPLAVARGRTPWRPLALLLALALTTAGRAQSSVIGFGAQRFDSSWRDATNFAQLTASANHTVALRADGSVVAWGNNTYRQCDVPALPAGLVYVEVAAGDTHTLARRSDGAVVAWGANGLGQGNVPALPPGVVYVEIAAGDAYSVARRSDGTLVAWGVNGHGQCDVP